MKKISGIYKIVCRDNGKYYYGSAQNIHRRWSQKILATKFNITERHVWDIIHNKVWT